MGGIGAILPWQSLHAGRNLLTLVLTGLLSAIYSLRELSLIRVPAPVCWRQVPRSWRSTLPVNLAAFYYGLGLGVGLATYVPVATFYVALLWAFVAGDPILGAIGMIMFGVGRALPLLLMASRMKNLDESSQVVLTLNAWKPAVHLVNGLALGFAGSCLLVAALVS